MKCSYKNQRHIQLWAEGKLSEPYKTRFGEHVRTCVFCQREVQALQKLDYLLGSSFETLEPSDDFEAVFWRKIYARKKESWLSKVLRNFESCMPVPEFSQVGAIFLVAFFIGGAGGVFSTVNHGVFNPYEAENAAIQSLSGFQEFKGIPSASVAGAYLKMIERKDVR